MEFPVFDYQKTVDCVRLLAEMYHEETGNIPSMIIAVGGSAMVLRGLRHASDDVDVFVFDEELLRIAKQLELDTGYTVDVTLDKNLWGDLNIYDIEEDAQIMKQIPMAKYKVDLAAISAETLFVIKASSLREKDKNDLSLILPNIEIDKLIYRAGTLFINQPDPFYAEEMLINVLGEIQVLTGEPIKPDFFGLLTEEMQAAIMPLVQENFNMVMAPRKSKLNMNF